MIVSQAAPTASWAKLAAGFSEASETTYRYDSQERLTHALNSEDGVAADRFEYLYDLSGNRVTALSPERTAHWNADPDNRPLAQAAIGPRRVVGTVSKPSHVKINGAYVPVDNDLRFEGFVDTLISRNVQIEASDITGNVTTQDYWFEEPQNTGGIVYQSDARGNLTEILTTEDTTTYQWDALDRLTVAERLSNDGTSGLRKSYHFDPASRLSRIESETWDGTAWQSIDTENYVFAGLERIQKRAANGTTVMRNYYADGFTEGGINYLYGRDRLGSIVELIDTASGAVVSRRDFSPFGIVRNESGSVQADFAYTGHFYDPELALHHSPTRVYDAGLGRWLSADIFPDAELLPEGTNLYAYVGNDPINFTDPLGLCRSSNSRNQANRPPPKQSGNSGSGGGDPPKRTASSASPQDGKNFGKNVEVTSWAGGGRQPDLGSGRWVVKGGATRWNFFKTELGGPKTANKFPYIKGSETPFKSITRTVPASRLIKPRTSLKEPFAIIKRAFGQYQLK